MILPVVTPICCVGTSNDERDTDVVMVVGSDRVADLQ